MNCVICGAECAKAIEKDKEYCCLCLPIERITKPLKDWLCNACILKRTKEILKELEE